MHKSKPKHKSTTVPIVPSEILTPPQVCKLLSISRVSLWRLVRTGRIPAIRLAPKITRFHRADILAMSHAKEGK